MPGNNVKRYATAAFVRFDKLGCLTRAEYEVQIRQAVEHKFEGKNESELRRVYEIELRRAEPLLRDLDAVDCTFRILKGEIEPGEDLPTTRNGPEIAAALSAVYFGLYREKPSQFRISDRVRSYAMRTAYADERTVWRWISRGIEIFAHVRGLVLDNNETNQ